MASRTVWPAVVCAVVPDTGPTSPDDPAWVDEIVRRALERAGSDASQGAAIEPKTEAPPDASDPTCCCHRGQHPAATAKPEPS